MAFNGIEVQPLIFGSDLEPTTRYPYWTGLVDHLILDDEDNYVSTVVPPTGFSASMPQGSGIAVVKCVGSVKFPGTINAETEVVVLRLVVRRNHTAWEDTNQIRTGLDARLYVGETDYRFAKAISITPKLGSDFEYWDHYWELPLPQDTFVRFALYGYIVVGRKAGNLWVGNTVDVSYARAYYGTRANITVPDIGTIQPFYPLDYSTFVTLSGAHQGSSIPPLLDVVSSPSSLDFFADDYVPALPALASPVSPPPPAPPSPPPPDIAAPSPPRAVDGRLAASVPFRLSVQPTTLTARVDRSGYYSGEFEVSLHVRPGGTQGRTYRVTDQISLSVVEDDLVSKVVKTSKTFDPGETSGVSCTLTPNFWPIKTGYVHRKTGKVILENYTNRPQTVLLRFQGSSAIPGQGSQSTINVESSHLTLGIGERTTLLYALTCNSTTFETEVFRLTVEGNFGAVLAQQDLTLAHHPDTALPEEYYVTGATEYALTIGSPVNLQLSTLNGPPGTERWRINDPTFLVDHNLNLSPSGWLSSDEVLGPVSMANVMVVATTEEGPGRRQYAARMITIRVDV